MRKCVVYILRCSDASYYTGFTTNLEERLFQHENGQSNSHTAARRPLRLAWTQEFPTVKEAIAAERQIKGWSRGKKEALIEGRIADLISLSNSRVRRRP